MFTKILTALFGTGAEREVKRLTPILEAVNAFEPKISALTNDELRAQTGRFKERLAQGATLDDLLPEAFATVREAAKRVAGMRHFDVQIIGGTVLHKGAIAEMMTGEGKTLVSTLPSYLNALTGQGVHVVTVNDYLARRDSEWMGPIFRFLGLNVGLIQQGMYNAERHVAYRADITYATNSEIGFDYLRDNSFAMKPEQCVQRGLNYAIVDEVDSILIDEARTPLIISGRPEKSSEIYVKVDDVVRRLKLDVHYTADEKQNTIILTDEGMDAAEQMLGVQNLYADDTIGLAHLIEQALKAHTFFKINKEYIVQDGEVLIVDEFTGRVMDGRRWSDGLHQAVEAKERVPVKHETQTMATITYQNLFRLYNKLSGMTGTAVTEALEFANTYKLDVIPVPPNLTLQRKDMTDLIFATERGKFKYLVGEIERINETGRPILVGTVSVEKSELVAKLLREKGVQDFQVLNAKYHEREAAIVANAGKRGAITIATNMAGRGTDIKLAEGIRELGGLAILGTERHESRRIDNQLRGRAGRQGDPGSTRFYVSLEDEVARLFGGDKVKRLIDLFGGEEMDAEPLSQRMVTRSIERAQRQVEMHHFEIRKHLLDYDLVMDKQRKYIYGLRREVLQDKDISERLEQMFEGIVDDALGEYTPDDVQPDEWDLDGLERALHSRFHMDLHADDEDEDRVEELRTSLLRQVKEEYQRRHTIMAEEIRQAYREQVGGDESQIDFDKLARKRIHDLELMVLLSAVDDKWIEHLYEMDYLRDSVRLRAFGQKDPLLEYKQEGFELFQQMIKTIEEIVVSSLFRLTDPEYRRKRAEMLAKGQLPQKDDPFNRISNYQYVAADKEADRSFTATDTSRYKLAGQDDRAQQVPDTPGPQGQTAERAKPQPVRAAKVVGPNDPCVCGSGKKYKKCCGKNAV